MTTRFEERSMFRILASAGLVLTMSACQADLPHTEPGSVANAVFDPTAAKIPLAQRSGVL